MQFVAELEFDVRVFPDPCGDFTVHKFTVELLGVTQFLVFSWENQYLGGKYDIVKLAKLRDSLLLVKVDAHKLNRCHIESFKLRFNIKENLSKITIVVLF